MSALHRPPVSFYRATGLRVVVLTPLGVDALCKKSIPFRFVTTCVDFQRVKQRFYAILLRVIMKTSCPFLERRRFVTGVVFVSAVNLAAKVRRTFSAGFGILILHERYERFILSLRDTHTISHAVIVRRNSTTFLDLLPSIRLYEFLLQLGAHPTITDGGTDRH